MFGHSQQSKGGTRDEDAADTTTSTGDGNRTNGVDAGDSDVPQPAREDLLEAVNNRRRRYTIHYLQQYSETEPVDLADVSRQVAAWERGTGVEVVGYEDRKNVHTSLYQFHAPKLAEIGLVEYDKRQSTLKLTENGANLRLDLGVTDDQEGFPRYLPLLVVGLGVLVSGVLLNVPVLGVIPDSIWAVFVLSLVTLVVWFSLREQPEEGIVTQHPPEPVPDE